MFSACLHRSSGGRGVPPSLRRAFPPVGFCLGRSGRAAGSIVCLLRIFCIRRWCYKEYRSKAAVLAPRTLLAPSGNSAAKRAKLNCSWASSTATGPGFSPGFSEHLARLHRRGERLGPHPPRRDRGALRPGTPSGLAPGPLEVGVAHRVPGGTGQVPMRDREATSTASKGKQGGD